MYSKGIRYKLLNVNILYIILLNEKRVHNLFYFIDILKTSKSFQYN